MNTAARARATIPDERSGDTAATVTFHDSIEDNIRETESHKMEQKTRNDYCNRLKTMVEWLDIQINQGKIVAERTLILDLTDAQKNDTSNYHNMTKDFDYSILPSTIVKAFISTHKYKPSVAGQDKREQYGYDHLRKYHDSILYGAKRAKKPFPAGYREDMTAYLDSLQKERIAAKGRGELSEEEADPIRYPLFRVICEYSSAIGDAFLWFYTMLLWHCMARPINVDDITVNHFSMGVDSVIIKFNSTKKDKKGQRCSPKNCYSQPMDPTCCITTSMAVYLITTDNDWLSPLKKCLFINPGAKAGSASSRYNKAFSGMAKELSGKISEFVRLDHFDPYGLRKGSATHASTSTTAPPPTASIILRGEWSLGEVLDIYWKWAEAGDQYLGRVLAGFNPNDTTFDTLPPHFIVGNENPYVKIAMNLCFPKLLQRLDAMQDVDHFRGLLLRVLASFVYNSEFISTKTGFKSIPLLNNQPLLQSLKSLISTQHSSVVPQGTGIPPHISMIKKMDKMVDLLIEERNARKLRDEEVSNMLATAINEKAAQAGQITAEVLGRMLSDSNNDLERRVEEMFRERFHLSTSQGSNSSQLNAVPRDHTATMMKRGYIAYSYGGVLGWDVPCGWTVPDKCTLKNAFFLWYNGIRGGDGIHTIRPFRLLEMIPESEWKKYKVEWLPIMHLMEKATLDMANVVNPELMTSEYEKAVAYVLDQVSYLKDAKKNCSWTVSTWSKRISRSSIMKDGNDEDKARLSDETRYNKQHATKRKFGAVGATSKQSRISRGLKLIGL
jgi:hypothetical protein